MNNFILSFIFLICLILYYLLVGSFFLTKMKIEKNRFAVYVVVGWIITFVLGWITGFPAQLNAKSWYYFANHFQLALIIVGVVAAIGHIFFHKNQIKEIFEKIKEKPIIILYFFLDHLKRYWFIYLFVGVFTWFSITNLQPYTLNNYTDDHYIVKMVHNLKISKLLTVDNTGNTLYSYSKYGYAKQFSHHMFNTYEIVYTYFANLFGIGMVTFARFAMTMHNYLMWFLVFQLIGSIFVDSNKSQYTIIMFSFLIIPEGYAARGMSLLKIRIFENWRNQTAMYMGGSIVRNTAFPLLIYFSYFMFDKLYFRKLVIFPLIFVFLLSYQTTGISYVILFLPLLVFWILLYLVWKRVSFHIDEINKILISMALTAVLIVFILLFISKIDNYTVKLNINGKTNILKLIFNWFTLSNGIDIKTLTKIYNSYLPYYNNVFKIDSFAKIAPIIIIFVFLLTKDFKGKIVTIIISLIYLIFRMNRIKLTLSLISFEFYGTARMLNSVILLIIFLTGVLMILIIAATLEKLKKNKVLQIIIPITCLSLNLSVISYIKINMNNILKYNKAGDGIVSGGYSKSTIFSNDRMLPNFVVDIGEYFNKLPKDKYTVFSLSKINYKGENYTNQCLLMSSKKIASSSINENTFNLAIKYKNRKVVDNLKTQNSADWRLRHYLTGKKFKGRYDLCKDVVDRSSISYAVVSNKKYVNLLVPYNWKIVYGGKEKGYWVLKKI